MDIEMGVAPPAHYRRWLGALHAQGEHRWLCGLPPQEQASAFYRLWARKEAVLSAHGAGIAAGLTRSVSSRRRDGGWRIASMPATHEVH